MTGTGGAIGTGGASGGTTGAGGSNTGGTGTGGSGAGGTGTGGTGTGGVGTGGTGTGGAATGGSGGIAGSGAGAGGGAGAPAGGSGGGGATGAGGSAGAGGSGGGAGAAACPYKLCEGFESGTVGGLPTGWTLLKGYGNSTAAQDVGLATDQVHSGAMSLKSSSMATGQNRVQKALSGLGAVATKHWGRIFYKAQAVKPTSNVIHVTMVALEGTTEDRIVDTVEMTDGTHQWLFNVPDDSCCTGSAYSWSFDSAWHCAEWYVDLSTQSYRFFTDGTEVTQIAFTNNAAAKMSAWSTLAVGEIFYQQPPSPFVLWFDDLAINDTQIGCQ